MKWDYGGTALDRSKGNKRNWILVWEDGYCDFCECQRAGSGYMKGRLVGKVAADNSHKWVFKETPTESDPNFISSWNMTIEPGVFLRSQTIAIISVREGIIQLGSFDKIVEDLNLVINIQRKFSYLQSMPGVFAIQRPYLPGQHPYIIKPNSQIIENQELAFSVADDKRQVTGMKRLFDERLDDSPPVKSPNLGWNSPQNGISGPSIWSIPPLLPTMSCSLGALLSKLPSVMPYYNGIDALDTALVNCNGNRSTSQRIVKVDDCCVLSEGHQLATDAKVESPCHLEAARGKKPSSINPSSDLENKVVGFGPLREDENALNLN
ncbi:hypothetical protein Tsubulata_041731 [Turnera subulata]|uniref:Transcription factor MYC/MYB N-terminal domain-containing protein n=1 Tax=Turnera subulata TaxID=218843 RepID=A0A9Q0JA71_9ROSI|nr:hypothetical protein Tsubulata_041731 [Turnera subulata]